MDALACSICTERYDPDEEDRVPRVLRCGHTYCTLCLKTMSKPFEGGTMIPCPSRCDVPTCFCEFEPLESALRPNYALMSLVHDARTAVPPPMPASPVPMSPGVPATPPPMPADGEEFSDVESSVADGPPAAAGGVHPAAGHGGHSYDDMASATRHCRKRSCGMVEPSDDEDEECEPPSLKRRLVEAMTERCGRVLDAGGAALREAMLRRTPPCPAAAAASAGRKKPPATTLSTLKIHPAQLSVVHAQVMNTIVECLGALRDTGKAAAAELTSSDLHVPLIPLAVRNSLGPMGIIPSATAKSVLYAMGHCDGPFAARSSGDGEEGDAEAAETETMPSSTAAAAAAAAAVAGTADGEAAERRGAGGDDDGDDDDLPVLATGYDKTAAPTKRFPGEALELKGEGGCAGAAALTAAVHRARVASAGADAHSAVRAAAAGCDYTSRACRKADEAIAAACRDATAADMGSKEIARRCPPAAPPPHAAPHATVDACGDAAAGSACSAKRLSVEKFNVLNKLLLHAATCVKREACASQNCAKTRALLEHAQVCDIGDRKRCPSCRRIWGVLVLHARSCDISRRCATGCPVPFCASLRERMSSPACS